MRLLRYSLILASCMLAACNGGEQDAAPDHGQRAGMGAPPRPALTPAPDGAEPETNPMAPEDADVTIAGSDDRQSHRIPRDGLLPLARILEIAQRRVAGEIIEVELDDDDGKPSYELEILTPDGRSIEVTVDARRGIILEVEEE